MDNFIKEIGRSYIISSFLPAALFIPLGFLIFRDFSPHLFQLQIKIINSDISDGWVIFFLLIAIVWVGFFLYSSVDRIVKLYEGYFIPKWLKNHFARQTYKRQTKELEHSSKLLENWKDFQSSKKEIKQFRKLFTVLIGNSVKELQPKEIDVPLVFDNDGEPFDEKIYLPTRLGNILRASELYAEQRYKMEGITIWPRLFNVLPVNYLRTLEEKNNQMIFMLNSSLLSFGISLLAFLFSLVGLFFSFFSFIPKHQIGFLNAPFYIRGYVHISPIEYFGIAIFFGIVGYFIYSFSINVVQELAIIVRTGYDLFRFELLRSLNLPLPSNLQNEKRLWSIISEFFVVGERFGIDPKSYIYKLNEEKRQDVNNKDN